MKFAYVRKTGHEYFNTQMEAYYDSYDCGTCDGTECETCVTTYRVEEDDKILYDGEDKEEAIKIAGYDFT